MKHKIQTQIRNFISNVPKFNKKQTKCSSRLCPAINADLIPSIKQTITRKGGGEEEIIIIIIIIIILSGQSQFFKCNSAGL